MQQPYQPQQEQPLLVQLDKLQPLFTEEEVDSVRRILSSPLVKRYFVAQLNSAVNDFLANEAETLEQKEKLTARFLKMKGVQYVCTFMVNNFREEQKK